MELIVKIVPTILILIISLSPVAYFAYKIYEKDFDKEPTKILVRLFICGIGSTFLTLIITNVVNTIFPFFSSDFSELNIITLIPYVFLGVAAIEEFCKWIFVYKLEYNDKEFNHLYDGIVYAAFVALGFACFENVLYVFEYGISTGVIRAITAIPGHLCDGIMMGYYLSMAKLSMCNNNKKLARKNLAFSLLIPILAHGIYDYTVMASQIEGYEIFFYIFVAFIVLFFIYCSNKVQLLADNTYNLNPNYITSNDRKKILQYVNNYYASRKNNNQYSYEPKESNMVDSYSQQTSISIDAQYKYEQDKLNNNDNTINYIQTTTNNQNIKY